MYRYEDGKKYRWIDRSVLLEIYSGYLDVKMNCYINRCVDGLIYR